MDSSPEQNLLSGIEPFPSSGTSTPHASKLLEQSAATDSLNSTCDPDSQPPVKPGFSPSPVKRTSSFSSPVVTADSVSFTNAAQEITKRLQQSLASSLKREKEAEAVLSPANKKGAPGSAGKQNTSGLLKYGSRSASPLKTPSPSKNRVRFDDESPQTHETRVGESSLLSVSPSMLRTPTKTRDAPYIPSSPVTPVLQGFMDKAADNRASLLDAELSFLKLPQNEEEKQKLFAFMKQMETSSSGDTSSALKLLGGSVTALSSVGRKSHSPLREDAALVSKQSEPKVEKKGEKNFQLGRKKPDLKKTSKNMTRQRNPVKMNATATGRSIQAKKAQVQKNQQKSKPQSMKQDSAVTKPLVQYTNEGQETINHMEVVRSHLQGMLNMTSGKPSGGELNIALGIKGATKDEDSQESFRSTDTATLLSTHPSEFIPPSSSPDSTSSDMSALLNSATSSMFNILRTNAPQRPHVTGSSVSSSVATENNILRDTLEKERYRRDHCEKQIQKLQNKVLEIQQELAVGQSVTRKKDMMIEQLDKTLAKVVSGWKVHEQNLTKSVHELNEEKEKYKADVVKHRDMISGLQCDLNKVLDDLSSTQEKLQLREEEQKMVQQTFQLKTHEISKVIDQKNSSIENLLNDKEKMVEEIKGLARRLEEQEEMAEAEKDRILEDMKEQEQDLSSQLEQQKVKTENEKARNADLQKSLASTQQEVTRLEGLMASLQQTLENMKIQTSVEEAKYSATLRKMEAEHQIELEKKVTEKLTKLHQDAEEKEKELRESHHNQVMQITSSHQAELEAQCRRYEDRIEQLEKRWKADIQENARETSEKLKEKTENMRRQMVNKMQNLLQAHYNETLELVGNTTGNTPMRQARPDASILLGGGDSTRLTDSGLNETLTQRFNGSQMLFADCTRPGDSVFSGMQKSSHYVGNDATTVSWTRPLAAGLTPASQTAFTALPSNGGSSQIGSTAFQHVSQSSALSGPALSESRALEGRPQFNVAASSAFSRRQNDAPCDGLVSGFPISESAFEAEVNLPVEMAPQESIQSIPEQHNSSDALPLDCIREHGRQQHLQRYIKMLLEKSPGDPLDPPTQTQEQPQLPQTITTLSPIAMPSLTPAGVTRGEENKENKMLDMEQPNQVTSEVAMSVINFLSQQLKASQPSPDLIPVQKTKLANSVAHSPKQKPQQKPPQKNARPIVFQQTKLGIGLQPQTLTQPANATTNRKPAFTKSPKKLDGQKLSLQDLDVNKPPPIISQSQFSEVSRMLGTYMSGDTQEAAEKLLSYLSESQGKGDQGSLSRVSLKRNKPKTPSKSHTPAWR